MFCNRHRLLFDYTLIKYRRIPIIFTRSIKIAVSFFYYKAGNRYPFLTRCFTELYRLCRAFAKISREKSAVPFDQFPDFLHRENAFAHRDLQILPVDRLEQLFRNRDERVQLFIGI